MRPRTLHLFCLTLVCSVSTANGQEPTGFIPRTKTPVEPSDVEQQGNAPPKKAPKSVKPDNPKPVQTPQSTWPSAKKNSGSSWIDWEEETPQRFVRLFKRSTQDKAHYEFGAFPVLGLIEWDKAKQHAAGEALIVIDAGDHLVVRTDDFAKAGLKRGVYTFDDWATPSHNTYNAPDKKICKVDVTFVPVPKESPIPILNENWREDGAAWFAHHFWHLRNVTQQIAREFPEWKRTWRIPVRVPLDLSKPPANFAKPIVDVICAKTEDGNLLPVGLMLKKELRDAYYEKDHLKRFPLWIFNGPSLSQPFSRNLHKSKLAQDLTDPAILSAHPQFFLQLKSDAHTPISFSGGKNNAASGVFLGRDWFTLISEKSPNTTKEDQVSAKRFQLTDDFRQLVRGYEAHLSHQELGDDDVLLYVDRNKCSDFVQKWRGGKDVVPLPIWRFSSSGNGRGRSTLFSIPRHVEDSASMGEYFDSALKYASRFGAGMKSEASKPGSVGQYLVLEQESKGGLVCVDVLGDSPAVVKFLGDKAQPLSQRFEITPRFRDTLIANYLKFKWYAAESGPPILFSSPETISEKSTTVEFPLWFLKSKREFAPFRKPLPKHAAVHNVGKLRTWLNILDPAELSKRAKLIAHVIDESKHGLLEPLPHREVAQGAEASAGSVNYFLRGDELLRVETSPDDSSISSVTWPLKSGKAWLKNNLGGIAPPVFAGDGNPTLLLAGKTAESAPTADLVAQNLWILTPDEELRPFGRHKDAKPGSEDFRDSLYSIAELAARPHWVDFLQEQTAVGIPRQPTDKPGDATLANSHRLLTPVNLEQSGDVWNRVIFKDADKADTTFTLAVSKPPAVKPGEPKRKRKRVESLRTAVPSDLRRYLASHPTDDAKLTFRWRSASGGYGPRFVLRMPSTNDPLIGESKLPVWVGGDGIGTARSLFSKYRFGTSPVVKDGLAFVHEEILDSPEVVRRLLNTKSNQPFRVHIPPPVKKKTVTLLAPPAAGEKHGGLLFVLQRQPKTRLTALQLEPTVALESFLVSVQQAKNDAANLSMDTSVSENFEEVFWDQLVAEQQKAMEERHTLIFAGQLLKEGQMPPSATMADEQNRQTGYAYLAKSDGAYKRYVTYIDAQNKVQILKGERNVELSSFPRNSIDGVDFQSKATAEWARWSATLRAVLQFQGKQSRARDAGWKPVLPYRLIKD